MQDSTSYLEEMLFSFADLSVKAGAIVMQYYKNTLTTWLKEDRTPASEADEAAEHFLLSQLAQLYPNVPVIAEEASSKGRIPRETNRFILVDPIDGTRGFINQSDEFTVNIALIEDKQPRLGAIYAPARNRLWLGGEQAYTCIVNPGEAIPVLSEHMLLQTRSFPLQGITAVRGPSQKTAYTYPDYLNVVSEKTCGSSLKFCLIAQGEADIYLRRGRIMEWDVAAGHAILRAAGGNVIDTQTQQPVEYGSWQDGFQSPPFIATGQVPL